MSDIISRTLTTSRSASRPHIRADGHTVSGVKNSHQIFPFEHLIAPEKPVTPIWTREKRFECWKVETAFHVIEHQNPTALTDDSRQHLFRISVSSEGLTPVFRSPTTRTTAQATSVVAPAPSAFFMTIKQGRNWYLGTICAANKPMPAAMATAKLRSPSANSIRCKGRL